MPNKHRILVIGQAPAKREQKVPYDTTLLYSMLEWVGISKEQAQDMFEFEALSNEFPGLSKPGHHAKPAKENIEKHWKQELEIKVQLADKVWLLGEFVKKTFYNFPKTWSCNLQIMETYHPSRRNYSKIMAQKETLTEQIKNFING